MKPYKQFLIITGGTVSLNFLKRNLERNYYEKIICVDRGLKVAEQLGISVDYIVGDFDSVEKDVIDSYKSKFSQIIELNPIKDATDTQVAIELAIEKGAESIIILGGTGTRLDHMLGSIHILMIALEKGIEACILDEYNKLYLKKHSFELRKEIAYGDYISLIPLTEQVEGVTLVGMKYPLKEATLKIGESLGISNEIIDEKAVIQWRKGILIVVETKD